MKKIIILFLILTTLSPLVVNAQNTDFPFVLADVETEFNPSGYTPKAECKDESISSLISYFAIDTETSSPVSIPIIEAGTFQIFASFEGNSKYEKYETSAVVTINPIQAKIITDYSTEAYSKMENPIKYKIEPEWVSEFLDISIDYFPIEALDSYPKEKISSPVELGMYYTVFNVESKTSGVLCENKYMIYEIAAYKGKKLPSSERDATVPSSFKCTFQNLHTTYEEGKPVSVQYTLSPAAISGEILYRQIYDDGTYSSYTATPPEKPGEYLCGYFLGGKCIGEGNIFIDKQEVSITLETETKEFTSSGIFPTATCDKENVEISFTAFALDENGNVTLEEVPVPIKKCGKYSIIAYPKNTDFFKRTYSYGYIEIVPATPEITITETEFIYDGTEKNIGFETNPKDIKCSVDYYLWEDKENNIPLGKAPKGAGKYIVVITAYDKNGNYNTISKSSIMFIAQAIEEKTEEVSITKILIIAISSLLFIVAVIFGIVFYFKAVKRNGNKG